MAGGGGPVGGLTLHPGEGVESPEALSAREGARVKERVQAFAEDVLAEARAAGGINPYFEAMGQALVTGLGETDGGAPVQLGVTDGNAGLKKSYAAAASAFGRTGDPGFAPPGRDPTPSEQLRGLGAPLELRLAAQAAETAQGLASLTPLLSLTLQLRQTASGTLVDARLLERSGNPRFDAFVLRVAIEVVPKVEHRPPSRGSQHELRSVFRVDGWLRRRQSAAEQAARAFAPVAMAAQFAEQLAVTDPGLADFEYRATLVRAY